jgi:hypothetical protein
MPLATAPQPPTLFSPMHRCFSAEVFLRYSPPSRKKTLSEDRSSSLYHFRSVLHSSAILLPLPLTLPFLGPPLSLSPFHLHLLTYPLTSYTMYRITVLLKLLSHFRSFRPAPRPCRTLLPSFSKALVR